MAKKSESQTAVDRISELKQELASLAEEAKSEALEEAEKAVALLNNLGFRYRLVEGRAAQSTGRKGARQMSDGPCPICQFRTNPPHDGRKHRSQGDNKKAFTAAEMRELGLSRAD